MTVDIKLFRRLIGLGLTAVTLLAASNPQPLKREPTVVQRYCSGCHALNGRSELPYVPQLAGLSAQYMQQRLAAFRNFRAVPVDEALVRVVRPKRDHGHNVLTPAAAIHMVGVANGISGEDIRVAAEWYARQAPGSAKSIKAGRYDQGRELFENGFASQHVPACRTCHAADAQGSNDAPRLAGQHASYVVQQLTNFRDGGRGSSPMSEIARSLGRAQMRALATYLESR